MADTDTVAQLEAEVAQLRAKVAELEGPRQYKCLGCGGHDHVKQTGMVTTTVPPRIVLNCHCTRCGCHFNVSTADKPVIAAIGKFKRVGDHVDCLLTPGDRIDYAPGVNAVDRSDH